MTSLEGLVTSFSDLSRPDMVNRNQVEPEYNHGFWQIGWGSGKIVLINYAMRTVEVSYYDKGNRRYTFDAIFGCYLSMHGGTWVIDDASIGE